MISSLTLPTPIHRLDRLSDRWSVDLWVKRDDLIPQFFGGNKVRKTFGILKALGKLPDVLITNGGSESNHARVVALMGAQLGREVHLVLHGAPGSQRGNGFLCAEAGASLHYVRPEGIAEKIADLNENQLAQGKKVAIIPGGGHAPEGANAYAEAVKELPFDPDVIVHASGTGGTQAGLVLGVAEHELKAQVVGVSVARAADRGRHEIEKLLPDDLYPAVHFDDRFRFGGYEQSTPELLGFVSDVLRNEGLPIDPTYTGKAMYGLVKMIETGEIKRGSRIVFWHTGGLMNLLSAKIS